MGRVPPELSAGRSGSPSGQLSCCQWYRLWVPQLCAKPASFSCAWCPLKNKGEQKKRFCFPAEIAATSHRHGPCKCNCCVQPWDDWLCCACPQAAVRPTGAPLSWGLVKARKCGGGERVTTRMVICHPPQTALQLRALPSMRCSCCC